MSFVLAQSLLSPNLGLIFWTGLAFGLLLFLLGKYAWGPITAALEEREKTIEESITRAERALAEARQMQADNQTARHEADRQAQTILRDAREAADRLRSEDVERTRAEIQRMQAQAWADLERQKQQAMADLRGEVATLAMGAAEKLLGESLTDERQHRLVERFIAEMPQN